MSVAVAVNYKVKVLTRTWNANDEYYATYNCTAACNHL